VAYVESVFGAASQLYDGTGEHWHAGASAEQPD
jgi:hypothetical protein